MPVARPAVCFQTRSYAISVKPAKRLPGQKKPRIFKDKKAFQYRWYSRILQNSSLSPLLILRHNDFSATRLKKLRSDISAAAQRVKPPPPATPPPTGVEAQPALTIIRTGIFGAALRDFPGVNLAEAETMIGNHSGAFAVLTLPSLHPPQLDAILRAMDRSVPPRKPKTAEEVKHEMAEKNADPEQPGRRVKRQRPIRTPELKLVGAFVENRVLLPEGLHNVSKLPTLDTLRAQIVGLVNAPASQLAMVLGQAGGGKLAQTLAGLKFALSEAEK